MVAPLDVFRSANWSLGALGAAGPAHLINLFEEELSATLGQLGCSAVDDLSWERLFPTGARIAVITLVQAMAGGC